MWRALFLAIGIFAVILGLECLLIDKAVLSGRDVASGGQAREIMPPEWAPWSLMSSGVITMLYSFTVPRRVGAK